MIDSQLQPFPLSAEAIIIEKQCVKLREDLSQLQLTKLTALKEYGHTIRINRNLLKENNLLVLEGKRTRALIFLYRTSCEEIEKETNIKKAHLEAVITELVERRKDLQKTLDRIQEMKHT